MPAMSKFDHSDIDGRLLQVLLAVFEEQSVTRAAQRLDVTQSAVSHLLDKLRAIVGDPLFVKSGRGIVATARAEALAARARVLLDELRALRRGRQLRPGALRRHGHHRRQRPAARPAAAAAAAHCARARAGAVAAHHPVGRAERRDAARRPLPAGHHAAPAGGRRHRAEAPVRGPLPASTSTPPCAARRASLDDYLASEHVTRALRGAARARHRRVDRRAGPRSAASPSRCRASPASAPFLRGSTRLATLPGLLRASLLRGLAVAPPPFDCPPMPMYMVWHLRHQADPMHQWLRGELQARGRPGAGRGRAAAARASGREVQPRMTTADIRPCPRCRCRAGIRSRRRRRRQRPGPARAGSRRRRGRPACCCCTAFPSWPTAGASRCCRWPPAGFHVLAPDQRGYGRSTGWAGRLRRRPAPLRPVQPGARCARPGGRAGPPRGGGGGRPRLRRAGGGLVRAAAAGRLPPRGADERALRRPAPALGTADGGAAAARGGHRRRAGRTAAPAQALPAALRHARRERRDVALPAGRARTSCAPTTT